MVNKEATNGVERDVPQNAARPYKQIFHITLHIHAQRKMMEATSSQKAPNLLRVMSAHRKPLETCMTNIDHNIT